MRIAFARSTRFIVAPGEDGLSSAEEGSAFGLFSYAGSSDGLDLRRHEEYAARNNLVFPVVRLLRLCDFVEFSIKRDRVRRFRAIRQVIPRAATRARTDGCRSAFRRRTSRHFSNRLGLIFQF